MFFDEEYLEYRINCLRREMNYLKKEDERYEDLEENMEHFWKANDLLEKYNPLKTRYEYYSHGYAVTRLCWWIH